MAKTCPVCGLLNPPEAERCDCGWDFAAQKVERSYANPKDPENIAELGMTLARVGKRNLKRGGLLAGAGIGVLIWTMSLVAQPSSDLRHVVGDSARLLQGLIGGIGLFLGGLAIMYRGWRQRRGSMEKTAVLVAIAVLGFGAAAQAQWPDAKTPGAPRTPDGKVIMTAPAPRLDGKPDLSGIWQVEGEPRAAGALFGIGESINSRYFRNVLSDFPADQQPLTPLGVELLRKNTAAGAFNPLLNCFPDGVPHGDLLPEPFKIINSRGVIVMLYEVETTFRQIYMDGRKLPADPSPRYQGYSIGHWDGDTLEIESSGFNDTGWIDARGTPHTEAMRVTERFHRRDYGHIDLTITLRDPAVFTRDITFSVVLDLMPDTDVFEHYCLENEKDDTHFPGRARK